MLGQYLKQLAQQELKYSRIQFVNSYATVFIIVDVNKMAQDRNDLLYAFGLTTKGKRAIAAM